MNEATSGRPYGKDVMPRFVNALVKATGDEAGRALFPEDLTTSKVAWNVSTREIDEKATEGVIATQDTSGTLLKYHDDESDGQVSTAGSGHAVFFRRPPGKWEVDFIQIYGSRYGEDEPPKENFSIFICDKDFNPIREIEEPYSMLEIGDPKWHRLDFQPVEVPEVFYICVYFEPTYTKGFYMHYDTDGKLFHSSAALPWTFVNDVQRDWMMNVHLRKAME